MKFKVLQINSCSFVGDNLVKGLRKKGIKTDFYQPELAKGKNLFPKFFVWLKRPFEVLKIRKKVKTNDYDVIHIHYALYGGLFGIFLDRPFFLHCHGTDIRSNLQRPVLRLITLLGLKKAKKVFYSTPDLDRPLRKIRPEAVFLPNPINTKRFKPAKKRSGQEIKILIISKLDRTKNVALALKVAKKIKKEFPRIKFFAFNFGNLAKRFRKSDFEGIKLLELIEHRKMPKLINEFNLIIGQLGLGVIGISELEALSCGKTVIANIKKTKKVYEEKIPILHAENEKTLYQKIIWLLKNPSFLEKNSLFSRSFVKKYHSLGIVVDKLVKYYGIK